MATTNAFEYKRRVLELTATLTFEDITSAKMFGLPKGARLIRWTPNVKTAFSGGTAELDIGSSTDPDAYADAIDLSALGQVHPTTEVVQPGYETEKMEDIYMNVGPSNTVGEVDVTLLFSFPMDRK